MQIVKNYELLEQKIEEISKINNIINILYWDIAVNIPKNSLDSRMEEITLLDSIVSAKLKSKFLQELVEKISEDTNWLNIWQTANLKEIKRNIEQVKAIDEDLRQNYVIASAKCELVWRDARQNNDYQLLKPYLQKLLNYAKEIASTRAALLNCTEYDALVDMYDPGHKVDQIESVFTVLKREIPSIIGKIVEKQAGENILPITCSINKEKQILLAKKIMEIMGFDSNKGRLDESAHPACMGTSDDIRMTNRYQETDFLSGIMGIIHETGHALYEQNLPASYINQPVGKARGMSIHESQSLFMEMQVARSQEFCEFLAVLIRDELGLKGAEYSGANLCKLITRVKPDFIRVEADEVTYPLHVIIRFELEKLLISGELLLNDLPDMWNKMMHQYLGITPQTDREGVLQDIHWPSGSFGYFPSYTNGAIIAAMLMQSARLSILNLDQEISVGEFGNINKFLNDRIRGHGSLKTVDKLLSDATGSDAIKPEIYLEHLKQRYLY